MKKLLVLAVISTCAVAGWRVLRGGDDGAGAGAGAGAAHDGELVIDRIWIDHMPKHDRDQFHAFIAISDEAMGVFQKTSVWKGHYELFRYESHGDELRIVYPQDNGRDEVKTHAGKCSHEGFDYCLELRGASRGVKRYYSRKGWEIDGATRPGEISARIEAVLRAK